MACGKMGFRWGDAGNEKGHGAGRRRVTRPVTGAGEREGARHRESCAKGSPWPGPVGWRGTWATWGAWWGWGGAPGTGASRAPDGSTLGRTGFQRRSAAGSRQPHRRGFFPPFSAFRRFLFVPEASRRRQVFKVQKPGRLGGSGRDPGVRILLLAGQEAGFCLSHSPCLCPRSRCVPLGQVNEYRQS